MIARVFIFAAILLAAGSSAALEAGLRAHHIEIRSDFAGARLLIFGALDQPRRAAQNIAIVVRGPERHGVVWRKARIAGVWTNYRRADFPAMTGFYALAAIRPVDKRLVSQLAFQTAKADEPEFAAALARLMRQKGLIYEAPQAVTFLGDRLFRAEIVLPATAPIGDYQIGVYLLETGRVRARADLPLHLDKIGFGQFIFSFANEWPFFYGLAAVIIALSFGWVMSVVFRRLV